MATQIQMRLKLDKLVLELQNVKDLVDISLFCGKGAVNKEQISRVLKIDILQL